MLFPPIGFDSLWYHLPSVAYWLQQGHVTTAGFSPIIGRYPAITELIWLFPAAFTHTGRLLAVSGLSSLVVFALAVRALARSVGLGRADAAAAAALSVLTPVALAQSFANYVDIAVAAWVVATAALVHEAAKPPARPDRRRLLSLAAWIGVTSGIAVGSKVSCIVFVLATTLIVAWIARRSSMGALTRPALLALCVPLVLLGSSRYVRNLIDDSNPVSPFRVQIAGRTVFDGSAEPGQWLSQPPEMLRGKSKPEQLVRSWVEDAELLVHPRAISEEDRRGGLGPFWPLVGVPCLAVVAFALMRRRSHVFLGSHVGAAVVVLAGALGHPYWWWSRFTIPLVALGAVATLVVADASPRRWRVVIRTAAAGLALGGGALGTWHFGYPDDQWSGGGKDAIALAAQEGGFVSYGRVMPRYAWVDDLPRHSRVGLDADVADRGGFVLFPLFGIHLDVHVESLRSEPERPVFAPQDHLEGVAAVVAVRSGALEQAMLANPAFNVLADSPDGLRVFVRKGLVVPR